MEGGILVTPEEVQAVRRREREAWLDELAEALLGGAAWPHRTGLVMRRRAA